MTDLLLIVLIATLEPTRGTPGEHVAVARAASDACAQDGAWAGATCLPALLALARVESSLRAAPGRRWGVGAWQLQPGRPFQWRGVKVTVPRAGALEQPIFAAKWALRVLEVKWKWCDGRGPNRWLCAFQAWNSTTRAVSFARRVQGWARKMAAVSPVNNAIDRFDAPMVEASP